MDVPSQPTLADIKSGAGDPIPAVYVPTKAGNLFVLDRRDGKPIVPVQEISVPAGDAAPGDRVSPTQPRSGLNLTTIQTLSDKDMWGATMFDQLMCRVIFKRLSYKGQYTPPSEQGTLVFPGNLGVFEWGGIAVNADRQVALMNPMALPFVSKLIPRGPNNPLWPKEGLTGLGTGTEMGIQPQYGVPYGVEINPFLSPLGLPCKKPAWGYVAAVDMKTHQVVWRKRIGTIRDSLKGIQLPPLKIGVPMLGGPISTAGNLMFIAGTQDDYLRAYNVSNGDLLWQARLPAGGQATPMTYESNRKQYVVIMAGGHGSFGTKMSDSLIAYSLPQH
jgi:quinoprotein glucose dehydrogenase